MIVWISNMQRPDKICKHFSPKFWSQDAICVV